MVLPTSPQGQPGLRVLGTWTSIAPGEKQVQACAGEELADPSMGFLRLKGRGNTSQGRTPRADGWRAPGPPGVGDLCSACTQRQEIQDLGWNECGDVRGEQEVPLL